MLDACVVFLCTLFLVNNQNYQCMLKSDFFYFSKSYVEVLLQFATETFTYVMFNVENIKKARTFFIFIHIKLCQLWRKKKNKKKWALTTSLNFIFLFWQRIYYSWVMTLVLPYFVSFPFGIQFFFIYDMHNLCWQSLYIVSLIGFYKIIYKPWYELWHSSPFIWIRTNKLVEKQRESEWEGYGGVVHHQFVGIVCYKHFSLLTFCQKSDFCLFGFRWTFHSD